MPKENPPPHNKVAMYRLALLLIVMMIFGALELSVDSTRQVKHITSSKDIVSDTTSRAP